MHYLCVPPDPALSLHVSLIPSPPLPSPTLLRSSLPSSSPPSSRSQWTQWVQRNVYKTQLSPLCIAMQRRSLPGSQGVSVLNPGSPWMGSPPTLLPSSLPTLLPSSLPTLLPSYPPPSLPSSLPTLLPSSPSSSSIIHRGLQAVPDMLPCRRHLCKDSRIDSWHLVIHIFYLTGCHFSAVADSTKSTMYTSRFICVLSGKRCKMPGGVPNRFAYYCVL